MGILNSFSLEGKVALVTELPTESASQSRPLMLRQELPSYSMTSSRNW